MYIRYKVVEFEETFNYKYYKTFNNVSYYIGFLGVLGISLVANFQETNNIVMHMVGAQMAFGCGSVYIILQVYFCHL